MLLLFGDTHTYLYDYFTYALIMLQIHIGWVYSSLGSWQKSVLLRLNLACLWKLMSFSWQLCAAVEWQDLDSDPGLWKSLPYNSAAVWWTLTHVYTRVSLQWILILIQSKNYSYIFLKVILWHRHNGSSWSIYFQVSKPYRNTTQRISLWEANSHSLHFKRLARRHWVTGKFSGIMNPK